MSSKPKGVKVLISAFDDCDSCGSPNQECVWVIRVDDAGKSLALCQRCFGHHVVEMADNPIGEVEE